MNLIHCASCSEVIAQIEGNSQLAIAGTIYQVIKHLQTRSDTEHQLTLGLSSNGVQPDVPIQAGSQAGEVFTSLAIDGHPVTGLASNLGILLAARLLANNRARVVIGNGTHIRAQRPRVGGIDPLDYK